MSPSAADYFGLCWIEFGCVFAGFDVAVHTAWCELISSRWLMRHRNGRFRVLTNENLRYYDERSGRWYVIHWDDILNCFVTELEPSEQPAGVVEE